MDGKLTGKLSLGMRLKGKLSVMPRAGPTPVLRAKTITENGVFLPVDDGWDGYSKVVADVPPEPIAPYRYDMDTGYVMGSTWTPGGDTVNYSDEYRVSGGRVYLISLGNVVGTRFRAMFSVEDTSAATHSVTGATVINRTNPLPYAYLLYTPPEDGYITITKDNTGKAGIITSVFDYHFLIDGNTES